MQSSAKSGVWQFVFQYTWNQHAMAHHVHYVSFGSCALLVHPHGLTAPLCQALAASWCPTRDGWCPSTTPGCRQLFACFALVWQGWLIRVGSNMSTLWAFLGFCKGFPAVFPGIARDSGKVLGWEMFTIYPYFQFGKYNSLPRSPCIAPRETTRNSCLIHLCKFKESWVRRTD